MAKEVHDLVIIGAGPSALAAAIYAAREGIATILIEKSTVGGLMATVSRIDNYPGFSGGIEGSALAADFRIHAEKLGAKILMAEVREIEKIDKTINITTEKGVLQAKAALISTGNNYRRLSIAGEENFYGKGVHYCAICDGALYRNKRLAVVGGANSAVQEAILLTNFASHIDLVVRSHIKSSDILKEKLSEYINNGKITLYEGWVPDRIISTNNQITSLAVRSSNHEDTNELLVDGVFIFAGVVPNTKFLIGSGIELDRVGHIITDSGLMTNIPGIFASGDVRGGATKQISSAIGEGTTAAMAVREYLGRLRSGLV